MTSSSTAALEHSVDPNRLINAKQLAAIFPASKMTIWRLEKQGKLPKHVSVGGRNYWRYTDVIVAIQRLTEPR